MESNSDKQLRDKLKGTEFPFDPQAWEKMEVLLDRKKKRRGFFWWWAGGIAASLLLVGIIGYEIGVSSGKLNTETVAVVNSGKEQVNTNTATDGGAGGKQLNASGQESETGNQQNGESKEQISNSNREKSGNTSLTTPGGPGSQNTGNREKRIDSKQNTARNQSTTRKKLLTQNQSKKATSPGTEEISYSDEPSSIVSAKNSKRGKRKNSLLQKANKGGVNTTIQELERNIANEETETFASAVSSKNALQENIELNRKEGLLESASEDEKSNFKKADEDALPKKKKRIFNYSLGLLANVSGTTLGSQSDNGPERPPLFYRTPSYAVGFTHDFLFLNRIAISNSILYSQTGFKVYNPAVPADSSSSTLNYSSAISELQIPIGIKYYPVAKKYFRFSIAAGIINHIKLKEVFTVEKETQPIIPNNIVTMENTFVSTADNPFTGGLNKSNSLQDVSNSPDEQAEYFGLGGLKRYYASFYASAGIEVIAKKHFVFFTEPMFYMSLNKIGLQDKRKYNVGVSGGFRYQF